MSKILFLPFSVLSGILAGMIGKKTFERLWGIFDNRGLPIRSSERSRCRSSSQR